MMMKTFRRARGAIICLSFAVLLSGILFISLKIASRASSGPHFAEIALAERISRVNAGAWRELNYCRSGG
jgi:hypothetical protein